MNRFNIALVNGYGIAQPCFDGKFCYANEAVAEIEALRAKLPRWIPVTERLPGIKPPAAYASDFVPVGFWLDGTWFTSEARFVHGACNFWVSTDDDRISPSHWFELPPAPEQEPPT